MCFRRVASRRSRQRIAAWWMGLCVIGTSAAVSAQTVATNGPLTLDDAIRLALKNYPALHEARSRADAAEQAIDVTHTDYYPRLDMLWQTNRATTNNVFGLLLPQGLVPPISGPVLGTTSLSDSVWGSAAAVQLSWRAIDFGLRHANVELAEAQTSLTTARADLTELDVAAAAADAFLTVLASDEAVRAVRANVDRLQVFDDAVRTLVRNQLRPGADASRADAELAIAKNALSQVMGIANVARARLAQAMGIPGTIGQLDTRLPGAEPTVQPRAPLDVQAHPAARAESAAISAVQARELAISRSVFPHVDIQATFAGRGTGAVVPGQASLGNGLSLTVPNWAVGVSVTFPSLEIFTARARQRVESENERAERAHYEQVVQDLTTEEAVAQAQVAAALEIASNTPAELTAATQAETQVRARYTNGLADITEVADVERLLAQADVDGAIATIGVWRARLAAARAHGDLTAFTQFGRRP